MKGKIVRWNDERGFGFIKSDEFAGDIFLHVSNMRKASRRPLVGDQVTFQVEHKGQKVTSVNVQYLDPNLHVARYGRKRRRSPKVSILVVAVLFGAIAFLIGNGASEIESASQPKVTSKPQNFTCGTKTHCSEMNSCEEAMFYLESCSYLDLKIDGDGDGVPCEKQWCNY
ncbi:cold shock domain-containing protein [Vibrio parahaemolyticus]|uniref:cold shock domain-containing protein n=1 Tax=Vibrio parahaemolyticus TaxID=670 RepID=UPI000471E98F|nr:cold shock domain-containing protein [Vibrio parahaemolyticus]HDY7456763.1 cold shock domain-containing protein [Vibrio vulnificus]